ncbi:MAG: hypothetical protein Q9200_001568 [Gallowayella weberi]
MAEAFGIAAGIITLITTSRKAADGISKILDLKDAPNILLALNNEVVDLHFVIQDLAELEQRFQNTLYEAITPSFRRVIERTKEVLLSLDKLIAFRLTTPSSEFGLSRVDRSISIQSYSETRRIDYQVKTFATDNAHYYQEVAQRLIGVQKQLNKIVPLAKPRAERVETATEVALAGKTSSSTLTDGETIMSNVRWFWGRAVSATFSAEGDGGRSGPELILRFPCIRPLDGDWGKIVQGGDIKSLMNLINRKYASLHDVDSKYGGTALHWAMHHRRVVMTSTLLRSGADLAAEDGFGLTPRHCLLFDKTYIPECFTCHQDDRLLLLQRLQTIDTSFEDDLLEEPILRKVYQGPDTYEALRNSISSGGGINERNSLGETVLVKAIGHHDEPAVRILLEHGASATQGDRHGNTPIWRACIGNSTNIVRLLLAHGADPTIGSFWNPNVDAVFAAVTSGRDEVIEVLLDHLRGEYICKCNEGINLLHAVAGHAKIQTIDRLCSIKWISTDVEAYLNSPAWNLVGWTPYMYMEWRRSDNKQWARWRGGSTLEDDDPEQIYKALMALVQKIVDDHYGFSGNRSYGGPISRRRMIAVPREGSDRFFDIVEAPSVLEIPGSDTESDATCDSMSGSEDWEDAIEDPSPMCVISANPTVPKNPQQLL